MHRFEELYEMGKLYCDRGDFILAVEKLRVATKEAFKEKKFDLFLKATNLLLRLYAEREQFDEINHTKEQLQDLVLKEGFELNSKTYYTLALCASYKGQDEIALDYIQKALAIALSTDKKEDICYAISGTAVIYAGLGRYNEALKEIYNLQIFFQVLDLPEIKISILILNAWILIELKKYDQSIDILWQAYDLVKLHKTMTMHIYILFNLGKAYLRGGDKEMASMYLTLAHRMTDSENMVHLSQQIKSEMDELGRTTLSQFDLVFDLEKHAVIEKKLGRIDFKNQFILLDLLKLFVQNQGKVYSKEYLVEHVWRQSYHPGIHDNKIYVTIKRLRKMIEPDYDKPKYIFRAKNGYFMNKSAKILLDQKNDHRSEHRHERGGL